MSTIQMNPTLKLASIPSSASAASSSLSALLGAGADLATVIFAMQIEQYDRAVRNGLEEIDHLRKQREAMSGRLDFLRSLRAFIVGSKDTRGENDEKTYTFSKPCFLDGTSLGKMDYSIGPDGRVVRSEGLPIGKQVQLPVLGFGPPQQQTGYEVSVADVDAEINRLQGQAQALDADREIKMIMLNQYLNKKEQATTQLTNLIKKTHDTRSAIVANLR